MDFEQLKNEIFDNFEEKHKDILDNSDIVSKIKAEEILKKYNTNQLSDEQIEELKKLIVDKNVKIFTEFVKDNENILNSDFTHQQKLNILLSKYATENLSEEEFTTLKYKINRHIFDNEVGKILTDLVNNIKKLPQEEQDEFWGKEKKD